MAIAEFASAHPARTFWFSVTDSETQPDAWLGLYCFALAQFVRASSVYPGAIQAALLRLEEPLLLVIDNAQKCRDLDVLNFLFEAAAATTSLSILLIGTDDPAFVSKIRSRGIAGWRLPGLSEVEAIALVEWYGGSLSRHQRDALECLRLRVDGHLGMIKISQRDLRSVKTSEQVIAFVGQLTRALGAGLDSLQATMIERLRNGMDDEEIELCRRLSLVVEPFPRHVGESVWSIDLPVNTFAKPWNRCVAGVFESQSPGKYCLPDLYRDGFRQETDAKTVKSWHKAIADAFETRDGTVVDILDVHAAVAHRLLSGDARAALESAAMYLAFASGSKKRDAQRFLLGRFDVWLGDAARDSSIPVTQRIKWHAIRARVYADLGLKEDSESASQDLYDLLCDSSSAASPESMMLGWMMILIHGATSGQPERALHALTEIRQSPIQLPGDDSLPYAEFMVISAFVNSRQSPLSYMQSLMKARTGGRRSVPMWSSLTDFPFWRAVIALIYSRSGHEDVSHDRALALSKDVADLGEACRAASEWQIACLVDCTLAQIQIDLLRDFDGARTVMQSTSLRLNNSMDTRVTAYVLDTLGDALRCSGQYDQAIITYEQSLDYWSPSDTAHKAETLLMLGIAQAKVGEFRVAATSARSAAKEYLTWSSSIGTRSLERTAASCLLEAALFSLLGNDFSRSLRSLIDAHHLLKDDDRNAPEWPTLAQVALCLCSRLQPNAEPLHPHEPGFSLGLSDSVPGAEHMMAGAPTIALAQACVAAGRPHRAVAYYYAAIDECTDPAMKMNTAIIAIDAAVMAGDLVAATKFAVLGSSWLDLAPAEFSHQAISFVFDHMIGRAIRIASCEGNDDTLLLEIDRAIAALEDSHGNSDATELLALTLDCYRRLRCEPNESALEEAFQRALACRAFWVAHDIAWNWCFRFALRNVTTADRCFLWHWRVSWLSLHIAPHDAAFLARTVGQARAFWDRIPNEFRSDSTSRISQALSQDFEQVSTCIANASTELAAVVCEHINVTEAASEMAAQMRATKSVSALARPLDRLYLRTLDLVLHPGVFRNMSTVRGDIAVLMDAIALVDPDDESFLQFKGIDAIAKAIESGRPSEDSFNALLRAINRTSDLGVNSAAHLFILIRHFPHFTQAKASFGKVCELLQSQQAIDLLNDAKLLPALRIRLAICHTTARSFIAHRRLVESLTVLHAQQVLSTVAEDSAIRGALASRDDALDQMDAIVAEFQSIRTQALEAGLRDDVWSCCFELGGARRLAGAALLAIVHDESAAEIWLRPSMDDFRQAVDAVRPLDSPEKVECALRAVVLGRSIAQKLNARSESEKFDEVIQEVRASGQYEDLIRNYVTPGGYDELYQQDAEDDQESWELESEDAIQRTADLIIKSTGWPAERRPFVVDDLRKATRITTEKKLFCRHLEPLQSLSHLKSPETAYTSVTKYVCSCLLLGHTTRIECDEIEAVFDAMKRVYCEGCKHKNPLHAAKEV